MVAMLLAVGDLVEDVVVALDEPVNQAADTVARISRRRGGSAANVAAAAAAATGWSRFVGQVGDDAIGAALVAELAALGVDVTHVARGGSTGTIVALVDSTGERSMLTDRRACVDLADPDPAWLDGVDVVHLPLYSFAGGRIAATSRAVATWSRERALALSIDLSSTSLMRDLGIRRVVELLDELRPDVVLGNAAEAGALGIEGAVAGATTVVKRGPEPVLVHLSGGTTVTVDAPSRFVGVDTTGAGDAFAAGFLTADWHGDPAAAAECGHRTAARLLSGRVASVST